MADKNQSGAAGIVGASVTPWQERTSQYETEIFSQVERMEAEIADLRAQLARQGQGEAVAEIGEGFNGPFHYVRFYSMNRLPVGTKLYAAPASAQPAEQAPAVRAVPEIDTAFLLELVGQITGAASAAFNHAYCPSSEPFKSAKQRMVERANTLQAAIKAIDSAASPATVTEPAAPTCRKATTELSLPELAEQFAAVAELGCDYTLSAGVCAMLHRAMTTGETERTEAAPAAQQAALWTITRLHDMGTVKDARGEIIGQTYYSTAKAFMEAHNATLTAPAGMVEDAFENLAQKFEAQHTWITNVAAANIVRTALAAQKAQASAKDEGGAA